MAETPSELKAEIEKLEARYGENPEGRFFVPLANAYRKSGDLDRAEALLRAGLRQHPDYLSAHIVLGRSLADRGAMAEATGEFEYVLSVDPQNLIALRTLGELAAAAGRSDEAARWYEELLAVDPMNEDARRALDSLAPGAARAEPDGGDEDAAGIGPGPDTGGEVVTETIAELYARQGLHDRAAGVYRELVRRRGGDPALERRLAELEATLGQGAPATEPAPEAAPAQEPAALAEPAFQEPSFEEAPLEEPVLEEPAYAAPVAEEPRFEEPRPDEPVFDEPSFEEPGLDEPRFGEGRIEEVTVEEPWAGDPLPSLEGEDAFDASFEHGFEELPTLGGGWEQDVAEAAPETPAWAVVETGAEPESFAATAAAAPATIAELLGELVAWRPGSHAAPTPDTGFAPAGVEVEEPLVAGFEEEPWATLPPPEPEDDPIPGVGRTGGEVAGAAEEALFPWELPEEPDARADEAPVEELFSFDSFFTEAALEPTQPEPARAEPEPGPTPVESTPPAAQEEDDDLESFQAWLRSLKR